MMTPPFSMYDQKAGAAAGKYTLEVVHTVSGKDEEDGREVTIHRQERVELEFTVIRPGSNSAIQMMCMPVFLRWGRRARTILWCRT